MEQKSPADITNYLLWYVVDSVLELLDNRFQEIINTYNSDIQKPFVSMPRSLQCINQAIENINAAVEALYVEHLNFDIVSVRNNIDSMTIQLKENFRQILNNSSHLGNNSLAKANNKLNNLKIEIGYEDFLVNATIVNQIYEDAVVHPEQYLENILNLRKLEKIKSQKTLRGESFNEKSWYFSFVEAEAYYAFDLNKLVVFAGILQPPFYDLSFPKFMNYGGIGCILGHEIMHGFGRIGRFFNSDGDLMPWITEEEKLNFKESEKNCTQQYNSYKIGEYNLDGDKTLEENIADSVGIKIAYLGYKDWLQSNENQQINERVQGLDLTSEKLFFLSYAQNWCVTLNREGMESEIRNEEHSTGKYRVIGALVNSKEFSDTFQCAKGKTLMNPTDTAKCEIF